mgnify:CR=1 FL=1
MSFPRFVVPGIRRAFELRYDRDGGFKRAITAAYGVRTSGARQYLTRPSGPRRRRGTPRAVRRRYASLSESLSVNINTVRDSWTNRTGEYSPAYYAHRGPNETSELIREGLDARLDRDAAVLELGCGSGRHLDHLAAHGFEDLSGVDINPGAFDEMRDAYPELAADGTFHCGAIEDVVGGFDDGAFDAVFSVETLQHLHPDAEPAFEEIARITDELLITAEIEAPTQGSASAPPDVNYVDEGTPLFYRDWGEVFTSLGLVEVDVTRGKRDTTRTFRVSR